uniref:Toxin 4.9.6 n=1 Tax=Dendroaspis viridis TaxID=8621 RepID=3SOB6_DENVI|nr:RecName: Full=Toxin 4.9.6 [Dendroaspis viridis]
MICYSHKTPQNSATITCEEKTCYKFVTKLPGVILARGCGCPKKEIFRKSIHCCRSDKCNE